MWSDRAVWDARWERGALGSCDVVPMGATPRSPRIGCACLPSATALRRDGMRPLQGAARAEPPPVGLYRRHSGGRPEP